MSLISAADLVFMRSTEETAMDSLATIYAITYTAGALGNTTESYTATSTNIACDIWPLSRNVDEKSSGNQELSMGEFYISLPYNTSVTVKDLIVISGITYEITFVPLAQTWLTNLRLEARNYNGSARL